MFFFLDTPFKQQRLRAWQPILTPRTVLPTLFIIGLLFIPLGIGFFITSKQINDITLDYTRCDIDATNNLTKKSVPSNVDAWSYNSTNRVCTLQFTLPVVFSNHVFLYYRLTHFYQNHRRYVKSISSSQLRGEAVSYGDLSSCDPLIGNGTKPYYPCGLIANSLFNDTILSPQDATNNIPPFSEKGIAWPSDLENFRKTAYKPEDVLPPPLWNWIGNNGKYTQDSLDAVATNEHLMVWLRTAALPTFLKLYSHYDGTLPSGTYTLQIEYNYNVRLYGGTKSIVLSTMSWLGGKNPFLGIAYLVIGIASVVLGTLFLIKHLVSPRQLGDPLYLSWNQRREPPPLSAAR
jgi:hypothetical protein